MNVLMEKRNNLLDQLEGMVNKAKVEKRSLSGVEQNEFSRVKKEIEDIDRQLQVDDLEHKRSLLETREIKGESAEKRQLLESQTRAFMDYIVKGEMRALSAGTSGGAVIPTEISQMIVDKIVNQSMLLKNATIFNTNANLNIPVFDFTSINSAYLTENSVITDTGTDWTSVSLTNKIIGALIKVSRSLVNRSDINVLEYLVGSMAKNLLYKIESELILGTGTTRLSGLVTLPAGQQFQSATTLVITPDELIDLQMRLPQAYQDGAQWIMNPLTLADIYKKKDTANNYLFNRGDFGAENQLMLLGKPVMLSDSVAVNAPNALPVFYGNPKGLYVKMTMDIEAILLDQAFAGSYQYGILGAVEMDSALAEVQSFVAIKGK